MRYHIIIASQKPSNWNSKTIENVLVIMIVVAGKVSVEHVITLAEEITTRHVQASFAMIQFIITRM